MMDANDKPSMTILMVEDNAGDVLLTREALTDCAPNAQLLEARDGQEALDVLRQSPRTPTLPRPDLILLDLNMPRMNGLDCLRQLKTDADLKCIPVVVLTTSAADEDVYRSYELQANSFITKPVDFSRYRAVLQVVIDYWFTVASRPGGQRQAA